MNQFLNCYPNLQDNKLFMEFISTYKNIWEEFTTHPTREKEESINRIFTQFLEQKRIVSYMSKLVENYAKDKEQNRKKYNRRYEVTLDQPLSDDSSTTYKDVLTEEDTSSNMSQFYQILSSPHEWLEIEKWPESWEKLPPKQKSILSLYYEKNYSFTDIAKMYEESPQNIFNHHKSAIKSLRRNMNIKEY